MKFVSGNSKMLLPSLQLIEAKIKGNISQIGWV